MKKSIKKLLITTAAIGSIAGISVGTAYGISASINSNSSNSSEQQTVTPGVYTDATAFYAAIGLPNGTPFQLKDQAYDENGSNVYEEDLYLNTTFTPYTDGAEDRKSIEVVDSYDIGNGMVAVESPSGGSAISLKLDNPYVDMETAEGVGGQNDIAQFSETYLSLEIWDQNGSGASWATKPTSGQTNCDLKIHVVENPEYPDDIHVMIEFVVPESGSDKKYLWGTLLNEGNNVSVASTGYFWQLVPMPTTTSDPLNQEGADIIVPYTVDHFNMATGNQGATPFTLWDGTNRLGYFKNTGGTYDEPTETNWISAADEQQTFASYYTSLLDLAQPGTGWETSGIFTLQWINPNDPADSIKIYDETALSEDIRPGKAQDYGKYNYKDTGEYHRGYAFRIYIDVSDPQMEIYIYNPFTGKYLGGKDAAVEDSVLIEGTTDSYQAITTDTATALELRLPNQDNPAVIGGGITQPEASAVYDPAKNTLDLSYFIYLNTWGVDEDNDGNPFDDLNGDGIIDEGWIEIWINPKGTTNEADYTYKILDTATLTNQQILLDGKGMSTFTIENVPPLDPSNTTGLPTVQIYIPQTGQRVDVNVTL